MGIYLELSLMTHSVDNRDDIAEVITDSQKLYINRLHTWICIIYKKKGSKLKASEVSNQLVKP
jgi:hypothetical protein